MPALCSDARIDGSDDAGALQSRSVQSASENEDDDSGNGWVIPVIIVAVVLVCAIIGFVVWKTQSSKNKPKKQGFERTPSTATGSAVGTDGEVELSQVAVSIPDALPVAPPLDSAIPSALPMAAASPRSVLEQDERYDPHASPPPTRTWHGADEAGNAEARTPFKEEEEAFVAASLLQDAKIDSPEVLETNGTQDTAEAGASGTPVPPSGPSPRPSPKPSPRQSAGQPPNLEPTSL